MMTSLVTTKERKKGKVPPKGRRNTRLEALELKLGRQMTRRLRRLVFSFWDWDSCTKKTPDEMRLAEVEVEVEVDYDRVTMTTTDSYSPLGIGMDWVCLFEKRV